MRGFQEMIMGIAEDRKTPALVCVGVDNGFWGGGVVVVLAVSMDGMRAFIIKRGTTR